LPTQCPSLTGKRGTTTGEKRLCEGIAGSSKRQNHHALARCQPPIELEILITKHHASEQFNISGVPKYHAPHRFKISGTLSEFSESSDFFFWRSMLRMRVLARLRSRWLPKLFLLLFLSVTAGPCWGELRFRALLVGINYEGSSIEPRLNGAVNDARDLGNLMTDRLAIPQSSIRILLERQATRNGIIGAFREWLIEGTEPGDTVFFAFSGHGVLVPDTSGTQMLDPLKGGDVGAQALAEALAPYDTEIETNTQTLRNVIRDAELHELLEQLQGRNVTLLMDCCHSAGVTRDIVVTQTVTRCVRLPWEPSGASPPEPTRQTVGTQLGAGPVSRAVEVQRRRWRPAYSFFAAANYFQGAREYPLHRGRNGAFTYSILRLLGADPAAGYTNQQVLDYAARFVSNEAGITDQSPMFFGPAGKENDVFVLLGQKHAGSTATEPPKPSSAAVAAQLGVQLTGQRDELFSQLSTAIAACGFARLSTDHPQVIADVRHDGVHLFSVSGAAIHRVQAGRRVIEDTLSALEGIQVVRELATLENPATPFAVEIWIDEPGKTEFVAESPVTLYFNVHGPPKGAKVYLTLINVSPAGTISLLYPKRSDFSPIPGAKLYANAEVTPGKVHSIPRRGTDLPPGHSIGVDATVRLEPGQEYFKAIVTSEPVDWERMNLGDFRNLFQGTEGQEFAGRLSDRVAASAYWGTGALRVTARAPAVLPGTRQAP
jgi:hypothetical protein